MFQFPGFATPAYGFSRRSSSRRGLPHSEIPGSKPARSSPGLIATCYVLHRLSVPRHPPDALIALVRSASCPENVPANPPSGGACPSPVTITLAKTRPASGHEPDTSVSSFSSLHDVKERARASALARPCVRILSPSSNLMPHRHGLVEVPHRRSLVEVNGIEPMTSCLQSRRSPN